MSEDSPGPVFEALLRLFRERGVPFEHRRHAPTHTSEESARARGESVAIGGKAILMKVGDRFLLFVMSAARRIDSAALKVRFGERRIRFATPDELKEFTGLLPGSVPPFGRPILPFDLYVDDSVQANDRIAFNAGSLTDSVIMPTEHYLRIAGGTVFPFSMPNA